MLKKDVREWLIKVDFADYCESFKGMFYDGHIVPRAVTQTDDAIRQNSKNTLVENSWLTGK